jgi:hypothetical protein
MMDDAPHSWWWFETEIGTGLRLRLGSSLRAARRRRVRLLLALELAVGLGATTPPKDPPVGDTALPALRASDTYVSSVRLPTSAGLITTTMPTMVLRVCICDESLDPALKGFSRVEGNNGARFGAAKGCTTLLSL